MATKAKILYTNGDIKDVQPKNGTDFSLEELQEIVGGWIQIVNLNDRQILVINEEGKLDGLPGNELATQVYCIAKQPYVDTIVGNALLCDTEQVK